MSDRFMSMSYGALGFLLCGALVWIGFIIGVSMERHEQSPSIDYDIGQIQFRIQAALNCADIADQGGKMAEFHRCMDRIP